MSHEVENMFSVSETPWHRLGVILDKPPTVSDAIRCAGLAWNVSKKPLQLGDGRKVEAFATVRDSDNRILGHHVGPAYTVLQNTDAFAFFDPFLRAGEATLETAGSLREGSRVWILARLNRGDSVIVPKADDRIVKYLLLSNSHDGTLAARVGFTPTRVVCANTLAIAHTGVESKLLRVKHTSGIKQAIANIRETVDAANATFEATAEQYRRLARRDIRRKDLEAFVKIVFKEDSTDSKRAENMRAARLDTITTLFERGKGNDLPGVRGTVWAAYNAVTEYLQYERRGDDASRLDSLVYGSAANTNAIAFKEALRLAA